MDKSELKKRRQESIGYLMGRAQRSMAIHLQKALSDAGLPITKEHWLLLANLWIKDGQNQQELASNVFKDKASITRSLNMMEAGNLLVRLEDKIDRRNKRIYLSEKGKDIFQNSFPVIRALHEEALKGIPEKDVQTSKKVLRLIYENLTQSSEKKT